jgi:4a-hydroxytetrahydrobiopterin dehydratase
MSDASSRDLAARECVPCKGGVPPLAGEELRALEAQLGNGWKVVEGHHLEKEYRFRDFREALAFTNRVGELAERQNHHPDIALAWGRVGLKVWTHKIDGLTESDFVWAAKADRCLEG